MTPRRSETHDIAFLQQDNGELEEDVVGRHVTGGPDADRTMAPSGANTTGTNGDGDEREHEDAELDEEGAESFPASDPPSHWSGGSGSAGDEEEMDAANRGRVVGRAPVEHPPGRRQPDDPLPGSLSRPTGGETPPDRR